MTGNHIVKPEPNCELPDTSTREMSFALLIDMTELRFIVTARIRP